MINDEMKMSECFLELEFKKNLEKTDFEIKGQLNINEFFNNLKSKVYMDDIIPKLISIDNRSLPFAFNLSYITFEQPIF